MGLESFFFGTDPIAWVQDFFGQKNPFPFRVFSLLGDTWGILFVLGLSFWLFGRKSMYALLGIVVLGAAAKLAFAAAFSVDRPEGRDIVVYEEIEIGSFPSGHVFQGVGPWGLLYALGHLRLWAPAMVAILVSLGRVYLGVHYVGDVLAGVVIGAAFVWAYWKVWPHLWNWLSRRSRSFYTIVAVSVAAVALVYLGFIDGRPRRYEIVGMVLGAAVALPLEYRRVGYEPKPLDWPIRLLLVCVGTAVLALFVVWDRLVAGPDLLLGVAGAAMATIWAVAGAPALFIRLGWAWAPEGDTVQADDRRGRVS